MHRNTRHWLFAALCFALCAAPAAAQSGSLSGTRAQVGRYTVHVDDNLAILLDTISGRTWALAPNRTEWKPLKGGPLSGANESDGYARAPLRDVWARVSPFTKVEIRGEDQVFVEFDGKMYQLLSVQGLPPSEILAYARKEYGDRWEKRFVEDIVEVLAGMGKRPEGTVSLRLQDRESGKIREVPDAPLTEENRRQVYQHRHAQSDLE